MRGAGEGGGGEGEVGGEGDTTALVVGGDACAGGEVGAEEEEAGVGGGVGGVGEVAVVGEAEEGGKCDYGCFALLPLKAGWYEVEVDSKAPESAVYKSYYANPATGESTWKRPI